MILYPAIDIRGGQAVRLLQGDYERETAYDADPVDAAKRWAGEGAEFLHVVDLDGAKAGEPRNLEAVRRIAAAVECPIQVGGGLRDAESRRGGARGRRGAGGDRHRGAARPGVPRREALEAHGERVVVSVDARDGKVSLWRAGPRPARRRRRRGRRRAEPRAASTRFLCTAIEVDGTMEGPALGELNADRRGDRGPGDRLGRRRRPLATSKRWRRSAAPQHRGRDRRPRALRATLHGRRRHRRLGA